MSLFRYFALFISSLLLSLTAMAGEGLYVGAAVGYGTTATNFESDYIQNYKTYPVDDTKLKDSGAVGEFRLGYQKLFLGQRLTYSLAVEIFADIQDRHYDSELQEDFFGTIPYYMSAESDGVYGVSIMPGLFLTNNLLVYLDIGAVYMEFTNIETNFEGLVAQNPSGGYGDKSLAGLRTGVGIQWLISKNLSIDFSWARDSFDDNTFDESRIINNSPDIFIEEKVKFSKVYNDQFLLGFNYYFFD